jgi:6-phosphogluconolactonase (cycloisomerase 2 family)
MRIYIAPRIVGYKIQASSIDTQLDLTPGIYKTTVQAWDRCGNVNKISVNITVVPTRLKPVRFVYVADGFAKIWGYNANPSSGDLSPTAQGSVVVNDRFAALAGDREGYRVYGTFGDTTIPRGGIYAYFIDRRNGHLDEVPGSPFSTAPWGAGAIAVHPSGKFVFVATYSSDFKHGILIFRVEADGSLSTVLPNPILTNSSVTSLVPDPWGNYLYALTALPGSIDVYAIDQTSGALRAIDGSPFPISTGPIYPSPQGLVDLFGRFLYTSLLVPIFAPRPIMGFGITGKTGALAELSGSPFPFPTEYLAGSLAAEPTGRFLYVSISGSGIAKYSIDAGNGNLFLEKTQFLETSGMGDLTPDPSGKFLYFLSNGINTGSVGAFAIDPLTGEPRLAFDPKRLGMQSVAVDMVVTP